MISARNIKVGSITGDRLQASTITGAKIAADTIDSQHYAAASIDNEHLSSECVATAQIADGAVTSAKLADGLNPTVITKTVTAKTQADSPYSVVAADMGKVFTTRGASGAVTFTLPAASSALNGKSVEFFAIADQNMIVAGTAGELICFNDAAANSIAFQTAGEIIGGYIKATCDGTSWLIMVGLGAETQTPTIAT